MRRWLRKKLFKVTLFFSMWARNAVACAERGARLLDEKRPGWESEIDVDSLDMLDGKRCILGQLYGTYGRGLRALDTYFGSYYGFNGHRHLTEAWRHVLAKRKIYG